MMNFRTSLPDLDVLLSEEREVYCSEEAYGFLGGGRGQIELELQV